MKLRVKRSAIRTVLGFVLFLSAFTGTTFLTIVNAEPPALPPEAAPVERLREDTSDGCRNVPMGTSIAPLTAA
jgi:hypothetical protein